MLSVFLQVENGSRTRRQAATDGQAVILKSTSKSQVQSKETLSTSGKKQNLEHKSGSNGIILA